MIEVKTAEFKNHLSRFLHLVRETGEEITVFDRDRPVAKVIPYEHGCQQLDSVWKLRDADEARYGKWDEDFELPSRSTDEEGYRNPLGEEAS